MWLSKTLLQRMPRLTSSLQHSLGRRRGSSELRIWAEKYAETKIRYHHCYRTSDLFVIMFYMFHSIKDVEMLRCKGPLSCSQKGFHEVGKHHEVQVHLARRSSPDPCDLPRILMS